MKEIIIRPEGIFLAKLDKLSVDQVGKLRKKYRRQLIALHRAINEVNELEQMLNRLNSEEVKTWEQEVKEKSQALLKEYIGEEAYQELCTKGEIRFSIGRVQYRLTKKGEIFRGRSRTRPLCIVRDRTLPLPDFIVAELVSIKNNPNQFRHERIIRRRR